MIFIINVLSALIYNFNSNFKRNSLKCYCNFHVVNSIEDYFDVHALDASALWDKMTVKVFLEFETYKRLDTSRCFSRL